MVEYQTRSQRHQIKAQKNRKLLKGSSVVPLVGVGMLTAPAILNLNPEKVQAAEYNQSGYSVNDFIAQIAPAASEVAAANDLYASVMIAQAMLESGNGSSQLSAAPYYNLFGVKGDYYGQSVSMPTLEFLNGQWVQMDEPFRQYNSYWEAMQDHASLLRSVSLVSGTYYYSGAWKSNTSSFYDATAHLTGRYATDPDYASKLNYYIEAYGLTAYDTPGSNQVQSTSYQVQETQQADTSYQTTTQSTGGSYTVVSGDTLWDIASRYGTTVDQLMANNGLSSDLIVVGQTLVI